ERAFLHHVSCCSCLRGTALNPTLALRDALPISCGEFLLGLVDVAGGQCRVARDQIGGAKLVDVDHLARQQAALDPPFVDVVETRDRKSTRLNSSHVKISYAVFCLKKKSQGRARK